MLNQLDFRFVLLPITTIFPLVLHMTITELLKSLITITVLGVNIQFLLFQILVLRLTFWKRIRIISYSLMNPQWVLMYLIIQLQMVSLKCLNMRHHVQFCVLQPYHSKKRCQKWLIDSKRSMLTLKYTLFIPWSLSLVVKLNRLVEWISLLITIVQM